MTLNLGILLALACAVATQLGFLYKHTVTADRHFAHEVTRREWVGVALAALGLAFLAATLKGAGDEAHSDYTEARLVTYELIVATAAVAVAAAASRGAREGVMLGASAGLFWAVSIRRSRR